MILLSGLAHRRFRNLSSHYATRGQWRTLTRLSARPINIQSRISGIGVIGHLDPSIKQYADSLYEKALTESAVTVRRESTDYLLERSKNQNSSQLFSGIDFQAQVRIYANHIERSTAARLDSYQRAYREANRLPTEGELTEILDDFKTTSEVQIRHATHALNNFLATRNVPGGLDVSAGLRATSAHGHDRVLQEWKIWRGKVGLQKSASSSETRPGNNVPACTTAALPNAQRTVIPVPKGTEDQAEPGFRRFSRLAAHGLTALFFALVIGALAVSGIISSNIGHIMWLLAWSVGSLLIFAEVIPTKSLVQRLICSVLLGALIMAADIGAMRLKRHQDLASQISQQVPKNIPGGSAAQQPPNSNPTSGQLRSPVTRDGAAGIKVPHAPEVSRSENRNVSQTIQGRAPSQAASQPPASVDQRSAPQTQLDKLIETNKHLSVGDRERLSDALFDFAAVLDQANALWGKANLEGGQLNHAWQSGSIVKDLEAHRNALREIDSSARDFAKSFTLVREKWKYYPVQTNYIFGDNPDNSGPNTMTNAIEEYSNHLDRWATIQNKGERPILNLFETEQVRYDDATKRFILWKQDCERRLEQMKNSIQ